MSAATLLVLFALALCFENQGTMNCRGVFSFGGVVRGQTVDFKIRHTLGNVMTLMAAGVINV